MQNLDLHLIPVRQTRITSVTNGSRKRKTDSKNRGGGESVFCNPPYGRELPRWVRKAYEESQKGNTLVVMLIPARTDTKYFHDYILNRSEIRYIEGRLKFGDAKNSAPFPSMIVIFRSGAYRANKVLTK